MGARKSTVRDGKRMSLAAHLIELRKRAFRASIGIVVGVVLGYLASNFILEVLRTPIVALAESRNASLNYDSVSGAFELKMKIAMFAGVVVSSPIWLYQAFAFFVPGLTRTEKKYTFGFFFSAVPLFLVGCATGFTLFPHIVDLLAGFVPAEDSTILSAAYYFDFVMKLVLAVGIAFVLPVFVVLLNFMGVLPGATVVRGWRVVVLAIVLFCAIATPAADVMSMFLLAIPMTALFAAAAGIAVLHDRAALRRSVLSRATLDSAARSGVATRADSPESVNA